MTYSCEIDSLTRRLNIKDLDEIIEEVLALGLEYFKICCSCIEYNICIYLHFTLEPGECREELFGMTVEIPSSMVVNDTVLSLLKYSIMITSDKETTVFYISKEYSLGVYYLLCRRWDVDWKYRKPIDFEEVKVFLGE